LGIPTGSVLSLSSLREILATEAGVDVTCPYGARVAWLAVAFAGEEDPAYTAPWWRVSKDGKPYPKLPGGADGHRDRLLKEGVQI